MALATGRKSELAQLAGTNFQDPHVAGERWTFDRSLHRKHDSSLVRRKLQLIQAPASLGSFCGQRIPVAPGCRSGGDNRFVSLVSRKTGR